MKLTDGNRTVDIRMQMYKGDHYDPDWSNDFFAGLEYDHITDAYIVDDVAYCIDQANDWREATGDFAMERDDLAYEAERGWERCVSVEEVE